ncbi:MAG: aspartate--ammonia ligase [Flavobacteriia bacterium]|jgi:aspartate--ammonia ligase
METLEKKKQLSAYEVEQSISEIKAAFIGQLATSLNLIKVEAPLIVEKGSGINDDLNGYESPVDVNAKSLGNTKIEIVHSLAKWKRYKLGTIEAVAGQGLYTDMRALRPDEELSDVHSIYVDQWDWEKVIPVGQRTLDYLKETVQTIYSTLLETELVVEQRYGIPAILPKAITYLHTEDVEKKYPELSPKERENKICEEYGAVFLIGIGGKLASGQPHDGRAADYDDWSTPTSSEYKGLNGDILLWNPILGRAFEISSMGIRVDKEALLRQLDIAGHSERTKLYWHQLLLEGKLPQTIGGGIGQSRTAMFLLRKKHIGEVQSSIWSRDVQEKALTNNINLL